MALKFDDVLAKLMRRLPVSEGDDTMFRADAERFFRACLIAVSDDVEMINEHLVRAQLNQIESEYECWLEDVRDAIVAARDDFAPQDVSLHDELCGAAAMASVYLLNLAIMEELAGKELMARCKQYAIYRK